MATETPEQVVTRAEIEQAITNVNETVKRMPARWTERRAGLHARIDELLDQRETAPE